MDNQDPQNDNYQPRNNGRILAGFFLLMVGAVFFMKEMAFDFFPNWLFTWPMILIAIGIYTGIKHEFRNASWLILIFVGLIFLMDEMGMGFDFHRFIVPLIIVAIGFSMIVRPRRSYRRQEWRKWRNENWRNWQSNAPSGNVGGAFNQSSSSENFFDSTSIFGGTKKVILSKSFEGGDITCIFGGCEIDFTQADLQKPAVIDITFMFGGGKIIVPSNWQVRVDMTPIFGCVEYKRLQPLTINPEKMLIIKGTCIFGGLEIKNY